MQKFRNIFIGTDFVKNAAGSCLFESGDTSVICTVSVEKGVPAFLKGTGKGWLTAEYAMLPASTGRRKQRDGIKKDGRGVEISRLIGRTLRQAIDLERLGEYTLSVDCDVLSADGGTRCASISGGFVALCLAVKRMLNEHLIKESPIIRQVAAISCGIVDGEVQGDLCYEQDSKAQVDMNIIMDDKGNFIEIQSTAEGKPFDINNLHALLDTAKLGISEILKAQRSVIENADEIIGKKQKLVVASNNAHKIEELKAMLSGKFDIYSMRDMGINADIEESGTTFEENAKIKAEYVMKRTGYLSLADDSGLCVDALDGAPGVYSARYAGEESDDYKNNMLLLQNLKGEKNRSAKFVSVLALSSPYTGTLCFRGEAFGTIIDEKTGDKGFGYDPYFMHESGKTFAGMTSKEKNSVSHRARAMEEMLKYLDNK